MRIAEGIVQRFHERGGLLPMREQPEDQEFRDATQLAAWKQALRGKSAQPCPPEVALFLDKEMPNWRDTTHKNIANSAMQKAEGIVQRYLERGKVLPRDLRGSDHVDESTRKQESRDSAKLNYWKLALKSPQSRHKCPEAVRSFLDEHMPGWTNKVRSINKEPMDFAMEIVERYIARGRVLPRELKNRNGDPDREEEYRDATKLRNWKKALRGSGTHMCSEELAQFLDSHMPGWRKPKTDKVHLPLHFATDIVARVQERQGQLPRELKDTRNDPARIQEYKDACKLNNWKKSLRGIGTHRCPEHIQAFLDEHLPTWRNKGGASAGTGGKKRPRDDDLGVGRGRVADHRSRTDEGTGSDSRGDEDLLMAVDGSMDGMMGVSERHQQQHVLMRGGDGSQAGHQNVGMHEISRREHENIDNRGMSHQDRCDDDHSHVNHVAQNRHEHIHVHQEEDDDGEEGDHHHDDQHNAMLELSNIEDVDDDDVDVDVDVEDHNEGSNDMGRTIMQTSMHSDLAEGSIGPDDLDAEDESSMLNVLTAQI